MGESSGLGGLFDKAKDAVKDLATDENIDKAADEVKKRTPDTVDGYVDKAAEEAKKRN
ncbi:MULTISPECIES: Rv0909 family putative TA system antitoxin [unclassified Isoptericola]|uniref:Rv0909 family putative TA system antitoxin n=1 Tax=unclassified Isoptericola TaxID=2623355 RepID=UPI003665DBF2